jgi:hypothetical protein
VSPGPGPGRDGRLIPSTVHMLYMGLVTSNYSHGMATSAVRYHLLHVVLDARLRRSVVSEFNERSQSKSDFQNINLNEIMTTPHQIYYYHQQPLFQELLASFQHA